MAGGHAEVGKTAEQESLAATPAQAGHNPAKQRRPDEVATTSHRKTTEPSLVTKACTGTATPMSDEHAGASSQISPLGSPTEKAAGAGQQAALAKDFREAALAKDPREPSESLPRLQRQRRSATPGRLCCGGA